MKSQLRWREAAAILAVAAALVACNAFAATGLRPPECFQVDDLTHQAFEYCVRRPSTGNTGAGIVYVMHGNGGNAQEMIVDVIDPVFQTVRFGAREPWIVSISYGPSAMLAPLSFENRAVDTADVTAFAIPYIERAIGVTGRPERYLLGLSLGGFNALNTYGASPAMFSTLALLCPAVTAINPFSPTEVDDFMKRNAAILDPQKAGFALQLTQWVFNDEATWKISSPIGVVQRGLAGTKEMFVSIGSEDDYGFFEGTEKLVKEARGFGANVEWAPVPGLDCAYDGPKLAGYFDRVIR